MAAFQVVARCGVGHPLVIRNHPVDRRGEPFPTLYWLTCPETVRAVARLESEGWIRRLNAEAERDPDLADLLEAAHGAYARERGRLHPGAEAWGGVGGAARGVKCLHAHYAHHVAGGPDPIGHWVAGRLARAETPVHYERPGHRLAVIDLGTNSIRLLAVRLVEGDPTPVELARDMVITRIGQGVDATGRLAPEALRRTVAVLRRFCRRARALEVERIHLAATSAVRDAANREDLAAAVLRETGEPMEILSGEDEARVSFLGATRGLAGTGAEPPFLVVDIGGGSTEFVLGADRPAAAISTQMGTVRLTERFVHDDPPPPGDLEAAGGEIDRILGEVERAVPVGEARTLVAVAGTATTVQAIALGLPEYDPAALHRTTLPLADAERVASLLADMTTAERRAIPPMAPGREDVIPVGASLLVRLMRRWRFAEALVSETDILDGLAWRLAGEMGAIARAESPPGR